MQSYFTHVDLSVTSKLLGHLLPQNTSRQDKTHLFLHSPRLGHSVQVTMLQLPVCVYTRV